MLITKQLPDNYTQYKVFDLKADLTLLVILNVAGLLLFVPAALLYLYLGVLLNPSVHHLVQILSPPGSLLEHALGYIGAAVLFMLLHELIHGFCFWIVTGTRPAYGFRGAYAFAAAADWYISRFPYLWIGLAPLIVLSIGGIALIPFLPIRLLYIALFGMVINLTGALGDVYVVGWLMLQHGELVIQDRGDVITIFRKQAA